MAENENSLALKISELNGKINDIKKASVFKKAELAEDVLADVVDLFIAVSMRLLILEANLKQLQYGVAKHD